MADELLARQMPHSLEAEQAALDHLAAILPYYIPVPTHIEINDMITKNKLYRASKGEKS